MHAHKPFEVKSNVVLEQWNITQEVVHWSGQWESVDVAGFYAAENSGGGKSLQCHPVDIHPQFVKRHLHRAQVSRTLFPWAYFCLIFTVATVRLRPGSHSRGTNSTSGELFPRDQRHLAFVVRIQGCDAVNIDCWYQWKSMQQCQVVCIKDEHFSEAQRGCWILNSQHLLTPAEHIEARRAHGTRTPDGCDLTCIQQIPHQKSRLVLRVTLVHSLCSDAEKFIFLFWPRIKHQCPWEELLACVWYSQSLKKPHTHNNGICREQSTYKRSGFVHVVPKAIFHQGPSTKII